MNKKNKIKILTLLIIGALVLCVYQSGLKGVRVDFIFEKEINKRPSIENRSIRPQRVEEKEAPAKLEI